MFKRKLLKGILIGSMKHVYSSDYPVAYNFTYRVLLVDSNEVVEITQKFCYDPKLSDGWYPYERVIVERRWGLFGYKYQVVCPLRYQPKEQPDLGTDNK